MTATVVEIKETDGWVNLTAAVGLAAGDEINIQNIGSRAVYLETSVSEPADLLGVDYLYAPKANPLTPTPLEAESVWANTEGFGTTKLSIADADKATITDPLLVTAATIDSLLEVTQGIPTAGFTGFSKLGELPATTTFAFTNQEDNIVVADLKALAGNNTNAAFGTFDILAALNQTVPTGGASFNQNEILQIRTPVSISAQINPTNIPTLSSYERVYAGANGGSGKESLTNFLMLPNETIWIQITNFENIDEFSFSGRFGKG